MKMWIPGLVTFFHDLFTVFWVGGLAAMVLVTMPAVKATLTPGPVMKDFLNKLQKRQSILVYISMVGLAVTGMMLSQSNSNFTGLFRFDQPFSILLSLKHIAMALMVIITLARSLVVHPANAEKVEPRRQKLSMMMILVNFILGVVILLLTGLLSVVA